MSPNTVHLIEKGETNPTLETLENLLEVTGRKLTTTTEVYYGKNVFGLVQ